MSLLASNPTVALVRAPRRPHQNRPRKAEDVLEMAVRMATDSSDLDQAVTTNLSRRILYRKRLPARWTRRNQCPVAVDSARLPAAESLCRRRRYQRRRTAAPRRYQTVPPRLDLPSTSWISIEDADDRPRVRQEARIPRRRRIPKPALRPSAKSRRKLRRAPRRTLCARDFPVRL